MMMSCLVLASKSIFRKVKSSHVSCSGVRMAVHWCKGHPYLSKSALPRSLQPTQRQAPPICFSVSNRVCVSCLLSGILLF